MQRITSHIYERKYEALSIRPKASVSFSGKVDNIARYIVSATRNFPFIAEFSFSREFSKEIPYQLPPF